MKPSLYLAACAAAFSFASPCPAQVPDGHAVVSTMTNPKWMPGTGGLFYVSLRTGKITAVTDLPTELTGKGATTEQGASCVAWRPSDGNLFVGETRRARDGKVAVWFVRLKGSRAFATPFPIGTPHNREGAVRGLAMLRDGRVLVAASSTSGKLFKDGPMKTTPLAIVDDRGTFTPVPVSLSKDGYRPESVAVDAPNERAFLVMTNSRTPKGPAEIWSVDIREKSATFGKATSILSLAAYAPSIQMGDDGVLYLGGGDPTHYILSELREQNGTWSYTKRSMTPADIESFCFERATDRFVVLTANHGNITGNENAVLLGGRDRKLRKIASAPRNAWGVPTGIAINPNLETYGTPTDREHSYRWVDAPNPGGLPLVGNTQFSLTIRATGKPLASTLLLGAGRGDFTVAGTRFWIDPFLPSIALPFPVAKTMTIPLGIPNASSFRGMELFVQSLHLDGKGFGATRGMLFTIE